MNDLFDASIKLNAVTKDLKDKGMNDPQTDPNWKTAKDAVEEIKKTISIIL